MSNVMKEPSIKLIPSDPMTNTILIIYCVSSTGASVPYKSAWRKINPKRNRVQQIKNHNGSSYRCSPLDIDCVIETTVYFQHQNVQLSRVVQSNMVKVSRQLKQRRAYIREPILCRVVLDEIHLEVKLIVQDFLLNMVPVAAGFNHLTFGIPIVDLCVDVDGNQTTFKIIFKHKLQEFLNFAAQMLGWKPQTKNNWITLIFVSDLNRDIILLGISESLHKVESGFSQKLNFSNHPRNPIEKRQHGERAQLKEPEDQDGGHSKNKSQSSLSPSAAYKQKIKIIGKFPEMKRSFTKNNGNQVNNLQKKYQPLINTPEQKQQIKQENKEKIKQREYLNVFQDEDLQLLGLPLPTSHFYDITSKPKTPMIESNSLPNAGDQPSINLRGSFEELQKSFNSNLNEEMIDRVFCGDNILENKKMQDQIDRLKKQNGQLKKQNEGLSVLTKENTTLKRKYLQMKEQINRLQMERKVILTDKLRCQVNWHKQIQQKQHLKKQLEHLREMFKNNGTNYMERSVRTNSFHDAGGFQKRIDNRQLNRQLNRSPPNSSFYR